MLMVWFTGHLTLSGLLNAGYREHNSGVASMVWSLGGLQRYDKGWNG
jgi:hypothetical protein